ncbi:hypothetical protein [Streptosporangium roseum]|uniref:hypothetical protein n=1 Tax=Streptosporangium roseum TaxID=2001 RepID=UPI000AE94F95|nr:hypothetical protein [Streptosporangium roseum]
MDAGDRLSVWGRGVGSAGLPPGVVGAGLADSYHLIAADHIGFGQSAMPPVGDFPYSFECEELISGEA